MENRMQKPGGNCASMPAGKEASLLSRSCKESLIQHIANQTNVLYSLGLLVRGWILRFGAATSLANLYGSHNL